MKQSQLEKAIANLEAQKQVIELAIEHLIAQRDAKSAKPAKAKPKPRPVEDVGRAS